MEGAGAHRLRAAVRPQRGGGRRPQHVDVLCPPLRSAAVELSEMSRKSCFLACVMLAFTACGTHPPVPTAPPGVPQLGPVEIAALVSSRARERALWAQAIADALRANNLPTDPSSVCAVVAIIGQESGFQEDPVVPG